MSTKRINGLLFEKLLYNGLANLQKAEQKLNAMNVFPVADGDTGTNMCLTLANGLRHAQSSETLSVYLRSLNEGLLLGARGNSGVILSQLFKGIYLHLNRCAAANCGDMRNAFIRGYKTAYQAVVDPVEGTILTVSREGIENIRPCIDRNTTMEALFSMYVAEMKKSLKNTPHLLPVLEASGVVDSGALGYITILEGMSKYLNGEILTPAVAAEPVNEQAAGEGSMLAFDENSTFGDGYCMEFILQLMATPGYSQNFDLQSFVKEMKPFGNSIAATRDQSRVKVHIHTKEPAWLIQLSQRYGEFLTFKLENMQLQHNEQLRRQKQVTPPRAKSFATVAVANSEGLAEQFRQLGCDVVLDGGPTMNTSSSEFVEAFDSLNAQTIVVLPNSKNVLGAARQAAELSKRGNIQVLPTASIAEGYFALSMDVGNTQDSEKRLSNMKKGMEGVTTLSVAKAKKSYSDGSVTCEPGSYIALVNDRVVFSAGSLEDAFVGGLHTLPELDDLETCVAFRGKNAPDDLEDTLTDRLDEEDLDLELSIADGGQPTYLLICGLI